MKLFGTKQRLNERAKNVHENTSTSVLDSCGKDFAVLDLHIDKHETSSGWDKISSCVKYVVNHELERLKNKVIKQ